MHSPVSLEARDEGAAASDARPTARRPGSALPVAAASPTMLKESAVTTMASASARSGQIGILARPVPEEAAMPCRQSRTRAARSRGGVRREAVIIRPAPVSASCVKCRDEAVDVVLREAVVAAVAADEHGDAWVGAGPRGAGRARARASPGASLRDPMRRRQGDEDVRPAQPVVLRHPDQVGGSGARPGILQEDREGAPARGPLDVRADTARPAGRTR